MKKTLAVVLAAMMAASLTACGGSAAKDTTAAAAKAPAAESTAEKTGEGAGTDETEKAAGTFEAFSGAVSRFADTVSGYA